MVVTDTAPAPEGTGAVSLHLKSVFGLDLSCVCSEPFSLLIVKVWRNFLINSLVVIIEHFLFFCCHDFRIDGVKVHRDVSDRFKVHELSVFVFLTFACEKLVLQTDTVASFDVDTRFVCDDHTFLKRLNLACAELPSESCRAFVNVQKVSNAVSCSMVEV